MRWRTGAPLPSVVFRAGNPRRVRIANKETVLSGDQLARDLDTKAVKGAIFVEDGQAYFAVLGLPGLK